ncbi:hypothetical protein E3N88_15859 [Mikania micrantha]|uniref:Uncharacterized protein n=1 Tax=Mikania micrantha TaxID=192012 RepID=A0A5N6NWS6_9ASTR|nr:hypothetical protein E3N88_15859 [Mikania micrantha]
MGSCDHISDGRHKLATKRLMGKVAIVTGGARGIGGATATLMSENGAHVVIADVLDEVGENLAKSIGGIYVHCDVSKETDVKYVVQLAISWKGKLDIMFNNAGIIGNGGSIICSSSSAAIMGGLASHAYTLTKGAIIGISRSAACELGGHGIRVNCVSPHGIPSKMLLKAYQDYLGKPDMMIEEVSDIISESGSLLHGRCGSFEDVAEAVLFLASDEAGFVTGHNLVVDGGFTSASVEMRSIYGEK